MKVRMLSGLVGVDYRWVKGDEVEVSESFGNRLIERGKAVLVRAIPVEQAIREGHEQTRKPVAETAEATVAPLAEVAEQAVKKVTIRRRRSTKSDPAES